MNTALRGAAIAVLLLLAATLFRSYRSLLAARLGAAFAVGVAAFAISSAPVVAMRPMWWHSPVVALSSGNAIVFWLFACALFQEQFRLQVWHVVVWVILAGVGMLSCLLVASEHVAAMRLLGSLLTISTCVFAALAVGQAIATWREDLVERRRRARAWLIVAIGGYTVLMTTAAMLAGLDAVAVLASTANALGLLTLSMLIAWQIMQSRADDLFGATSVTHIYKESSDPDLVAHLGAKAPDDLATTANPPPDPALVQRLTNLMEHERIYREHTLTIGGLADKLGLPEHKLRRVINQGLGYRNFNTFLNRYRLQEAMTALTDPARANLPVLTIALDTGFQSIGPFNRAFKAETGLTPTDFRRQRSSV